MTSTIPGATAGSGIRQTFNGNAGDTLTMYWNFIATDYSPFNDTAFAVRTTPDGTATVRKLAAIVDGAEANVASYNSTGWTAFTYTLAAAGEYAIGFGVIDHTDTALNPFLFVDDPPGKTLEIVEGVVNAPEPGTVSVLAGAALLLLRRFRRG